MKGGPAEGGGGRIITFSAKKSGKADGGPPPEKGGGRKREIALGSNRSSGKKYASRPAEKRSMVQKKGWMYFWTAFPSKFAKFLAYNVVVKSAAPKKRENLATNPVFPCWYFTQNSPSSPFSKSGARHFPSRKSGAEGGGGGGGGGRQ